MSYNHHHHKSTVIYDHQELLEVMNVVQGLMVATGEITGFDLAKKKVEICTKKGEFNDSDYGDEDRPT